MLDRYRDIAPAGVLTELAILADALKGCTLQHVNATRSGGVAELLTRLVPWTEALGIRTSWDVITGELGFFEVTKAMHNALQGVDVEIPRGELTLYLECLRDNARRLELDADVIIVHDPQPVYLVTLAPAARRRRMVWRCHIDLSRPSEPVWRFLREAVGQYAMTVFHVPQFAQHLAMPQVLVAPSIDPLSEKNRDLTEAEIKAVTDRFGIDRARPVLLQVSRFDRFKDPRGVLAAYRLLLRRRSVAARVMMNRAYSEDARDCHPDASGSQAILRLVRPKTGLPGVL